jgi:sec-independent protein translocase protein TatB
LPGSGLSDIIAPLAEPEPCFSFGAERDPMLFDLGWSEILLIGTVALVFIGPKDLPKAMRVAGYWVRKARTLSREFQSSIDQMVREAELDEMRQDLKKAAEFDLDKEFHNTIDPTGSLAEGLKPPELPSFAEPERLPAPMAEAGVETTAAALHEAAPDETAPPALAAPEPGPDAHGPDEPAPDERELDAHGPDGGGASEPAAPLRPPVAAPRSGGADPVVPPEP